LPYTYNIENFDVLYGTQYTRSDDYENFPTAIRWYRNIILFPPLGHRYALGITWTLTSIKQQQDLY